jgi:hypothetical protein
MAEALFQSARGLMASGDYAGACPKLAESERLDPKLGTLINLALCHEKSGLNASAWAEYMAAAELARRSSQSQREAVARQRVAALEPSLSRVIVAADAAANLSIMLDQQPLGAAAYGTAMPLDPGDHVLTATAPDRAPFRTSFHVAPGDPVRTVTVPALDPSAGVPAPTAVPAAPSASAEPRTAASGTPWNRPAGVALAGAGLVGVGIGTFFGIRAFSDKSDADHACGPDFCTPAGDSARSTLKTDELVSTIGILAGVAAVGVGGYLILSSRGPEAGTRVSVEVAPRGLAARVTW